MQALTKILFPLAWGPLDLKNCLSEYRNQNVLINNDWGARHFARPVFDMNDIMP